MSEEQHIKFMKRCLELASGAEGMTTPNPMVGALVVCEGLIIGEGFHRYAGGPHAEVEAIGSVNEKQLLKNSALYVSLEPCCHYGLTPPCTDLIIKTGIRRVFTGAGDTSAKVAGKGIQQLREAGIDVTTGLLEEEIRWQNRRFFTFHEKQRPYIILKWAQSRDGYIDVVRKPGLKSRPTWISGNSERALVHKWRSEEDVILIGAGTIRADSPQLNVRNWSGKNPVQVFLSYSGNVGKHLTKSGTNGIRIAFTGNTEANTGSTENVILEENTISAIQVCSYLYERGYQSVLVEGGAMVLKHFIENGLWDEARIFTGKTDFGEGVRSPVINGRLLRQNEFDASSLQILVNQAL